MESTGDKYGRTLIVNNISNNITEGDVRRAYEQFGTIESAERFLGISWEIVFSSEDEKRRAEEQVNEIENARRILNGPRTQSLLNLTKNRLVNWEYVEGLSNYVNYYANLASSQYAHIQNLIFLVYYFRQIINYYSSTQRTDQRTNLPNTTHLVNSPNSNVIQGNTINNPNITINKIQIAVPDEIKIKYLNIESIVDEKNKNGINFPGNQHTQAINPNTLSFLKEFESQSRDFTPEETNKSNENLS